ncbi:hypothetical protein D3C77_723770 [compost metagenome]
MSAAPSIVVLFFVITVKASSKKASIQTIVRTEGMIIFHSDQGSTNKSTPARPNKDDGCDHATPFIRVYSAKPITASKIIKLV